MKKITPIILLIVVAILAALGVILVNNNKNKLTETKKNTTIDTVKEKVTVDLYLEPEQSTAKVEDDFKYLVRIDSHNLNLFAAETYLHFDPNTVLIQSVQPGTVLSNPNILLNKIDSELGKISYALGTFKPLPANGLLFEITGKIKALPKNNILDLAFDKDLVKIAVQSPVNSKLYASDEIQILFHETQMNITQ